MLENLFKGLFDSASTTVISPDTFLLCVGAALAIGGMIAFAASRAGRFHASFLTALTVLLSALCCIMSALSMILYAVRNFRALRTYQNSQK